MKETFASGRFERLGDDIFRTEAKIHFGHSNQLLGLLIMLNPGSSELLDKNQWANLVNGHSTVETGLITLDETMKAVKNIMESSFNDLNGVLVIHNLFNLRDPNSKKAIEKYQVEYKLQNSSLCETVFNKQMLTTFPLVWIAWGVEDKKVINIRKKDVMSEIEKANIPTYGVYSTQKKFKNSKHKIYFCHPLPQNYHHQEIYKQQMITQFKTT